MMVCPVVDGPVPFTVGGKGPNGLHQLAGI